MASMMNMNSLLNGKDSRWLQLEVCREFQRQKCSRPDTECKFAHPPANVEVQNGRVTACYDSIKVCVHSFNYFHTHACVELSAFVCDLRLNRIELHWVFWVLISRSDHCDALRRRRLRDMCRSVRRSENTFGALWRRQAIAAKWSTIFRPVLYQRFRIYRSTIERWDRIRVDGHKCTQLAANYEAIANQNKCKV